MAPLDYIEARPHRGEVALGQSRRGEAKAGKLPASIVHRPHPHPPDLRGSRYTEPQLRVLYKLHIEQGISINALAAKTYEKVGFGSRGSAATAISRQWKRMGLRARDRIAQVKRTCTTHGLAPKHGPRPGYGTYKRRLKRPDQPRCEGVRLQPPRKGEPCERPAGFGSRFCWQHDPARRAEVERIAAKMRARQPTREMVPLAPFSAWLHKRKGQLATWKALAESTGLNYHALCHYKDGEGTDGKPKSLITRELVDRALYEDGAATLADLYPDQADQEQTDKEASDVPTG